jgi:hypothetical protein
MADIAEARERWAEQFMSDEHVLGLLPEEAARLLLDAAIARLDAAAVDARAVETLNAAANAIRRQARALAEAAAGADDPAAYLHAHLAALVAPGASAAPGEDAAPRGPEVAGSSALAHRAGVRTEGEAGASPSFWVRLRRRLAPWW